MGGISKLLEVLQEVAERNGKTPAQVSLNWVICKGAIPIPGASSIAQVKENVGALGWRLSSEDVALLDTATDELGFEFRGSGFQTADSLSGMASRSGGSTESAGRCRIRPKQIVLPLQEITFSLSLKFSAWAFLRLTLASSSFSPRKRFQAPRGSIL